VCITCSVLLGWWLEVLIVLGASALLGAFSGYCDERNRRIMRNIKGSKLTQRDQTKGKGDRIRDAVEKEWDRKSTFDKAEDLR